MQSRQACFEKQEENLHLWYRTHSCVTRIIFNSAGSAPGARASARGSVDTAHAFQTHQREGEGPSSSSYHANHHVRWRSMALGHTRKESDVQKPVNGKQTGDQPLSTTTVWETETEWEGERERERERERSSVFGIDPPHPPTTVGLWPDTQFNRRAANIAENKSTSKQTVYTRIRNLWWCRVRTYVWWEAWDPLQSIARQTSTMFLQNLYRGMVERPRGTETIPP